MSPPTAEESGHDAEHNHDADHDHDHDAEPITDHVHENSWSANLETPANADNRELLIRQAIEAIEHTQPGYHVNLVTHGDHGHPVDTSIPRLPRPISGSTSTTSTSNSAAVGDTSPEST